MMNKRLRELERALALLVSDVGWAGMAHIAMRSSVSPQRGASRPLQN